MCRHTRQIVAFVIGDRSPKLGNKFRQLTKVVKVTAISGKPIDLSFL